MRYLKAVGRFTSRTQKRGGSNGDIGDDDDADDDDDDDDDDDGALSNTCRQWAFLPPDKAVR